MRFLHLLVISLAFALAALQPAPAQTWVSRHVALRHHKPAHHRVIHHHKKKHHTHHVTPKHNK